ncbi:MAG: hypothetical protein R2825_15380 [Saprospiraceae bacterium]
MKKMHNNGIGILAGTDAFVRVGMPGYSLHEELQLLVEAWVIGLWRHCRQLPSTPQHISIAWIPMEQSKPEKLQILCWENL